MKITTVSSRQFNQDRSGMKKVASKGPVFITDRGKATHVLLTIQEYERMKEPRKNILELLAMPPGTEDIELELPDRKELARGADFS